MNKKTSLLALVALILAPSGLFAQSVEQSFYKTYELEIVLSLAGLVCFLALIALFTAWYALRAILLKDQEQKESPLVSVKPGEEHVSFGRRLWNRLNDSVPVAQEATVMTSHEYDGIRELDNKLPPWWLYGFFISILFGIGYLLNFHVFKTGDLQAAEYEKAMIQAEEEVSTYLASLDNLIDETNVVLLEADADLAVGKELFIGKCATCHGQLGEGGVGPNLTDAYWIHGGDVPSIFKTIKYGVTSKGMIAWKAQLAPKEMQQLSSYIYTLEGTNPPNQKEAQGELFEREGSEEEDTETEDTETAEAGM